MNDSTAPGRKRATAYCPWPSYPFSIGQCANVCTAVVDQNAAVKDISSKQAVQLWAKMRRDDWNGPDDVPPNSRASRNEQRDIVLIAVVRRVRSGRRRYSGSARWLQAKVFDQFRVNACTGRPCVNQEYALRRRRKGARGSRQRSGARSAHADQDGEQRTAGLDVEIYVGHSRS